MPTHVHLLANTLAPIHSKTADGNHMARPPPGDCVHCAAALGLQAGITVRGPPARVPIDAAKTKHHFICTSFSTST